MEIYRRGNWRVVTPIWVVSEEQSEEERIRLMICPHAAWTVTAQEVAVDEEGKPIIDPPTGLPIFTVMEACQVCEAIRHRWISEPLKAEPFDYTIPQKGFWYERLYHLGSFEMLVRRYQNNPNVPPHFMVRLETAGGKVHVGMYSLSTLLFSPAAVEELAMLQKAMKMGPERFMKYRILKEGRKSKREKNEMMAEGEVIGGIIQELGAETIASARSVMEGEIQQEVADMEEAEIEEMERQAQERRAAIQRRKSEPQGS